MRCSTPWLSRVCVLYSRTRMFFWCLALAFSTAFADAQLLRSDQAASGAQTEQDRSEHERLKALRAYDSFLRERAHAQTPEVGDFSPSELLHCPVYGSLGTDSLPATRGKPIIGPLNPKRFTPTSIWPGVALQDQPAASLFSEYISGPIVQSKCINCHVQGGISGHTRVVFSPSSETDHHASNLAVFQNFVTTVEGGADTILAKIQGVGHGGGIQVPAGSAEFANMERFLRLLGGGTSGSVTPETLFDGVTMASPAKALRRAALVFAGRLPTQAEVGATNLRQAIRGMMTGPSFHAFLLRAANDRLLTDRHLEDRILGRFEQQFPVLVNKYWDLTHAAHAKGNQKLFPSDDPDFALWHRSVNWGVARAPLELIAHIVENDRPYTEILTADYIMANPFTAEAYGSSTKFADASNVDEFRPARIDSYYRKDDSMVTETRKNIGVRVINPGNLHTVYPHAGILNTHVFLRRYPTTPTNRNRARSRWTYYHFLGIDIEKSASRTTDPDALADTDNPTMKNPACTVCHVVMDPVAGAYQNYGELGLYRDQWGGMDSLPKLYKFPEDGSTSPYQRGDSWFRDMREPGFGGTLAPNAETSVQWLAKRIVADERFAEATVRFWWSPIMGSDIAEPPEDQRDVDFEGRLLASNAQALEVKRLAAAFRKGIAGGRPYNLKDLLAEIALSPWFRAESVAEADPVRSAALRDAGMERLLTPEELVAKTEAITGYSWGRRLERHKQVNSFNDAWDSYRLLYGGIDSDGITQRARDVTPLMAAVAQTHAVQSSCPIALRELYHTPEGQRLLFDGIDPVLSPRNDQSNLFEITKTSSDDRQTVSTQFSATAGEKTIRLRFANGESFSEQVLNRDIHVVRLTVRGKDGGIVDVVDLESLPEIRCGDPKSGYYRLRWTCPFDVPINVPAAGQYRIEVSAWQRAAGDQAAELEIAGESFEVTAESPEDVQTVGVVSELASGSQLVRLQFTNDYYRGAALFLGQLSVLDRDGGIVYSSQSEALEGDCGGLRKSGEWRVQYSQDSCTVDVPVTIPSNGTYRFQVSARQENANQPRAILEVAVGASEGISDTAESAIRGKLVELHKKLLGVDVAPDSTDVETAYQLFRSVWTRRQSSGEGDGFHNGTDCDVTSDHFFFDGIAEVDENGDSDVVEWPLVRDLVWRDYKRDPDPFHVGRTWVVVLAYMLSDYRYVYH